MAKEEAATGRSATNDALYDSGKYKVFFEERKILIDMSQKQADTLDKSLLSIGTGIFALTLTALGFVKKPIVESDLFIVAYASIVTSIFSTLISLFINQFAFMRAIKVLQDNFLNGKNEKNRLSPLVSVFSFLSISLLCVGITILFIAIINLVKTA